MAASAKRLLGLRPDVALKDAVSGEAAPITARRLRSRLIETAKSLVAYPDSNRGWIAIAQRAALRLLREQRFDALITTSPPPSVHVAGRRVAAASGLPWIADLRDLWSNDRNTQTPSWRRSLDRRLERTTFRSAAALTTVSEPFANVLRTMHPRLEVRSILNGFDPDEVGLADSLTSDFTLTHTGRFYQGLLDPEPLFAALGNLLGAELLPRDRVRLRFFVRHEPWVVALARRHGVADILELIPWGPREVALRAQQETQVLVLLHWGGPTEAGIYTGKVFEYLAAQRPIIMIGGGEGVLHDLLTDTGAGVHVADRDELEQQLLAWWREFSETGRVAWHGRAELLERYSHRRMARDFSDLLDAVCAG
jgi:glycosyltransferase involved in cell wall biosynthesis